MNSTINDILRTTTMDYLDQVNTKAPPPPADIEADILAATQLVIDLDNQNRAKYNRLKIPVRLNPAQIAMILSKLYPVCTICTGATSYDKSFDMLAIYQNDGPNKGIYVSDDNTFRQIMQQYNFSMNTKEFNEAMELLRTMVPRKQRCSQRNLIAVNNGIFDYDTKTFMPFSPDLVFLTKSRVNYNPLAANLVIHNPDDNTDWDVETWMQELSDDPEVVNLLWEILGAIIRPLVPWNKSAWFYSETGNNGKGTLCELMRQLCGEGSYASISLADMSTEFMLEPLLRASAIIVDENDVGTFIDKAANLKAIITGDTFSLNRKYKNPVAFSFHGFSVQCLNEFPKVKDKSDSFFRRQLFIPFSKCFTGAERKYIKSDYLHRQDVLEYVLFRVLNMNYYSLSEPETCKFALEEYKEYNDPVRQFAEDVLPIAEWDLLPFTMLYAMYQTWYKKNIPSGKIQSRNTFINDMVNAIASDPNWECKDKKKQICGVGRMEVCEPLILIYDLKEWMNPKYVNLAAANDRQKCTPIAGQYTKAQFRGITRTPKGIRNRQIQCSDEDTEETDRH